MQREGEKKRERRRTRQSSRVEREEAKREIAVSFQRERDRETFRVKKRARETGWEVYVCLCVFVKWRLSLTGEGERNENVREARTQLVAALLFRKNIGRPSFYSDKLS